MKQKDIFIFQQNCDVLCGLYTKLSPNELSKALPLSYKQDGGNYLVCLFDENGADYVGQMTKEMLCESITGLPTYQSIRNVNYTDIQDSIPNCNQSRFNNTKSFLKEQLLSV